MVKTGLPGIVALTLKACPLIHNATFPAAVMNSGDVYLVLGWWMGAWLGSVI